MARDEACARAQPATATGLDVEGWKKGQEGALISMCSMVSDDIRGQCGEFGCQ